MPSPKFSIITVTFNAEKTIKRTLKSVTAQSYTNIEHIIVDGASQDNTLNIIKEYQQDTTKIIHEPDKGIYDAMNKGIKQATGDYLCFLNAGDSLHNSHTLRDITDSINERGFPDIIYGDTDIINDEGIFLYKRRLSPPEQLNWKSFKKGMLVCHQSFYVRRELALNYDLQYKFSSDFDWCIRIMKKADIFYNTHMVLTDYLNEGMTTKNHNKSLKERFHIMSKYYGIPETVIRHIGFIFRNLL